MSEAVLEDVKRTIVRSDEKNAEPAVDMMLIRVHLARSLYVSSTFACTDTVAISSFKCLSLQPAQFGTCHLSATHQT